MADRLKNNPKLPGDIRAMYFGDHPPTLLADRLDAPLRRKKPARIGCQLMGDLFHERVWWADTEQVFMTMAKARQHTFLVLTKRPKEMRKFVSACFPDLGECSPHIQLGVTAENQQTADDRIPMLLQTPAAVRFVSCEPLLAEIDLKQYLGYCPDCGSHYRGPNTTWRGAWKGSWDDPGNPPKPVMLQHRCDRVHPQVGHWDMPLPLDWVICGGESGLGARPMHPDWVRDIRDRCVASGVPFYFKGWGAWSPHADDIFEVNRKYNRTKRIALFEHPYRKRFMARVGKKRAGRLLDGREWNELPKA